GSGGGGSACVPADAGTYNAGPGICLRDDGGVVVDADAGIAAIINQIWGTSTSHVVAVGANGDIFTYDGTSWVTSNAGVVATLNGVWASATNDVWAVGNAGTIRHFDGSNWSTPPGDSTNIHLQDVHGSS